MRAIEKIRRYIRDHIDSGKLRPGDQLPSYHELMKLTGASYATILTAMKTLESEGLLEIRNGLGSYLSGAKRITVRILHNSQIISASRLSKIFAEHLSRSDLNLDVLPYPLMSLSDPVEWQRFMREERFALILSSENELVPAPANLSMMPTECGVTPMLFSGDIFHLPFAFNTSMMLYNPELLEKIAFPSSRLDCTFSWWDDLVVAAKRHGLHPAAANWQLTRTNSFLQMIRLLLALSAKHERIGVGTNFSFASETGRRFLDILRDTFFYDPSQARTGSFFRNRACISFAAGPWTYVQMRNPERSDITVKSIHPMPVPSQRKKQIAAVKYFLSAYFGESTTVEERRRVWSLMQIMNGKDFHLDFCNASGLVSARKDIDTHSYLWNLDGRWDSFFPTEKDQLVFISEVFPRNSIPALSTLLENFIFYGSDAEITLQRMDAKIAPIRWEFDYKTGKSN